MGGDIGKSLKKMVGGAATTKEDRKKLEVGLSKKEFIELYVGEVVEEGNSQAKSGMLNTRYTYEYIYTCMLKLR